MGLVRGNRLIGPRRTAPNRIVGDDTARRLAHDEAVARMVESVTSDRRPVQLAKTTSNLFRSRRTEEAGQTPAVGHTTGLDTTGLDGVLSIDPVARLAQVQGMCRYETLVEATLSCGLMPLVVPQLRTITLGGAVSGLGIESTSFRNGLPHESVREMDVLTGTGQVYRTTPDGPHADLFAAFPNSYGSLGYALRLVIELEPIEPVVHTRTVRFAHLGALQSAIERVATTRQWQGQPVDTVDGVVFDARESYLVLARLTGGPAAPVTQRRGSEIYYRTLPRRSTDRMTDAGYLWRWDEDWFWCSQAFGVQHPLIRPLWPRRLRRSDVYHRLVRWDQRYRLSARIDQRRGLPPRERVVQDVEVPVQHTAQFLDWLLRELPLRPVWICPLRLREPDGPGSAHRWPLYPLSPGVTYVNVGFWGTVPIRPGGADGDHNRAVEAQVARLHGHKSLYSDVYYDRSTFADRYGGDAYAQVKARYDPEHRFADRYDKVVTR